MSLLWLCLKSTFASSEKVSAAVPQASPPKHGADSEGNRDGASQQACTSLDLRHTPHQKTYWDEVAGLVVLDTSEDLRGLDTDVQRDSTFKK